MHFIYINGHVRNSVPFLYSETSREMNEVFYPALVQSVEQNYSKCVGPCIGM